MCRTLPNNVLIYRTVDLLSSDVAKASSREAPGYMLDVHSAEKKLFLDLLKMTTGYFLVDC